MTIKMRQKKVSKMTGNKAFIESIHPIIVFEIFEIMAPNA